MLNRSLVSLALVIFLLLITGVTAPVIAQSQSQKTVDNGGNEGATMVRPNFGEGYVMTGYSGNLFYIAEFGPNGILRWFRASSSSYVTGYSIVQTANGGIVMQGYYESFDTTAIYVVKLDSSGNLQSSKKIDGKEIDIGTGIDETNDGGWAVTGYTYSFGAGECDLNIMKFSSSGNIEWSKTFGGSLADNGFSIIQTTDGGYAAAGYTYSYGAGLADMFMVKVNSGGTLQWSRTVGGPGEDDAFSIIQTTDGGFALVGGTRSFGSGGIDMYIAKFDASGTLQWVETIGGPGDERGQSIIQSGSSLVAAGWTTSYGAGNYDMYVVKLDVMMDGTPALQWSRTIGGTGTDYAYSVMQAADGGYIVAGTTNSFGLDYDIYIVKLDAAGNTCANSTSPASVTGNGGTATSPTPTVTTPGFIVTNTTPTFSSGGTVSTICAIGIQKISNEIPDSYALNQNYPNPFNPVTKIKFSLPGKEHVKLIIYDMLGKEIAVLVNEELQAGSYQTEWDASGFSSGVYYYRLTAENYSETKKMVLIK